MILDFLGIGFGPSNISLNICLEELEANKGIFINKKFIERKKEFGWHSGMLLKGANLQVSFLKDLVTQRNPTSKYTFINFLHEKGRLLDFINLRHFEPTRIEFAEYLKWVALHFEKEVQYGHELREIEPVFDMNQKNVDHLNVKVYNLVTNEDEVYKTRNISLALGGKPKIPHCNYKGSRIVHSCDFASKVQTINKDGKQKIAVVGAGQSSAEMILNIHENFPNAFVDSIISKFNYRQSDSSLFVNEVFFNKNVDLFYNGNQTVKDNLISKETNYAVIDEKELEMLYQIKYDQKISGEKRFSIKNFTRVSELVHKEDSVEIYFENIKDGTKYKETYDYVFLGTGFQNNISEYLEGVEEFLSKDTSGNYNIERNYALKTSENFQPNIYLMGHSEMAHGITNTLLSVNAFRAQEVASSFFKKGIKLEV